VADHRVERVLHRVSRRGRGPADRRRDHRRGDRAGCHLDQAPRGQGGALRRVARPRPDPARPVRGDRLRDRRGERVGPPPGGHDGQRRVLRRGRLRDVLRSRLWPVDRLNIHRPPRDPAPPGPPGGPGGPHPEVHRRPVPARRRRARRAPEPVQRGPDDR